MKQVSLDVGKKTDKVAEDWTDGSWRYYLLSFMLVFCATMYV